MSKIDKSICEYMNCFQNTKKFLEIDVTIIKRAIVEERKTRCELNENLRTEKGKLELNRRIAEIANRKLKNKKILHTDVRLYKKCRMKEYEDRTNKCVWGFKEMRIREGFDPITGQGIKGD